MFVRFLLVFGLLFVNLVAICCERAVPLAFHSCCFNFSAVLVLVRIPVARPEACPLDMQAVPGSIPTSGTFFRRDLVMKKILRPFSLFQCFKKSSCQLLAKECALSTGKLPRRFAQEQCV